MNPQHPFDAAVALSPQGEHSFSGTTSPAYANMVGPFGGITAAQLVQAVLMHPQRLGEPVSLTVNYAAAVADGPFQIQAQPVVTGRSTQHWIVTQSQRDPKDASRPPRVVSTATVVTAIRRPTLDATDEPMPDVPAPEAVPRADRSRMPVAWLQRYAFHPLQGDIPQHWDDRAHADTLTRLWVRDEPPRPLDFASLTALCDVFFPRVWLKRARRVPAGTVSMTIYFHGSGPQLAAAATEPLLGQARAQAFRHGFFDQTGQLWRRDGLLLATTHQVVYFKD